MASQLEMQEAEDTADRLNARIARLEAALTALVRAHSYRALDMGIGTALPEGKMWLEARNLVKP